MRVLLLKFFPTLKGTTNHSTSRQYYASNNNSMNRANSKKLGSSSQTGNDGIGFSKSFTVKYGDQGEDDERHLVPLDDLQHMRTKSNIRANDSPV